MATHASFIPQAATEAIVDDEVIVAAPSNPVSPQIITETVHVEQAGGFGGIFATP
jgi:hypothetical protein